MSASKHFARLSLLLSLVALNCQVAPFAAQENKCAATANHVYIVDSGRTVVEVHPGENGGNGYQINIIGPGANNFEVRQEAYMTSLGVIPKYTDATQAKWGVTFAANMAHTIRGVTLKNKCTGESQAVKLDSSVRLLNR